MTEPEVAGGHAEFIRAALVRYEAPLVRYALGFTDDLETARDVVQDTFLRLCKQPPDLVEGHLCTTTIIIPSPLPQEKMLPKKGVLRVVISLLTSRG